MPGDSYIIEGGQRLQGSIKISGAKNAVLPCMAAALLSPEECILENVPHIEDVNIMGDLLRSLGAVVEWAGEDRLIINASNITTTQAPSELVVKNRASFLVMGPLLGRFGEAAAAPPGGDVIGLRPIDVHLIGFRALGADVSREEDKYLVRSKGLRGTRIFMDYPSNIGTENLMMSACLSEGTTVLRNAAMEPEIVCLAQMLNSMGARISGAGTETIEIEGVDELGGGNCSIIPDRIEAGTYAVAAAASCGDVTLNNVRPDHLDALIWKLKEAGVQVFADEGSMRVVRDGELNAISIQALPYPGFATDLQSTVGALLTQARGVSVIHERVYDNRLLYVSELRRMGAEVVVAGQTAIITGPSNLVGTPVRALDIRCGASLVIAGLVAKGHTEIYDVYHLDRGYTDLVGKLRGLGANIHRKHSTDGSPF